MSTGKPPSYVARTPEDLVALVPVVLGFHPQDSVVLLTFGPPGGSFHARVDLPPAAAEQAEVAEMLLGAVLRNGIRRAALVLYTDDVGAAESQAEAVTASLVEHGVDVVDVLRVEDGRWFAVPEDGGTGTAYQLESHRFTAQRVFDGHVVHDDRTALADSLVGTDEEDRTAVTLAATRFAELARSAGGRRSADFWATEARWLQRRVRQYADDAVAPAAADAGRLLVLSSLGLTRDVAWSGISRASASSDVSLWLDLVRRAPRDLLPGAAALLAFAAWQQGDGALAWCAIDRCVEVDPDHSMAHLVAEALTRAVPPDSWRPIPEKDLPVFRARSVRQVSRDRAS